MTTARRRQIANLFRQAQTPAQVQSVQLMGDKMFDTPEIEHLAKALQAIQEDVQVHKASTPQEPKQKVKYKFHVSNLIHFNLSTFFQKCNILLPFPFPFYTSNLRSQKLNLPKKLLNSLQQKKLWKKMHRSFWVQEYCSISRELWPFIL